MPYIFHRLCILCTAGNLTDIYLSKWRLSQIVRPSGSLWNRFSEEVQEILVPLQHSRYIMSSNKRTSFPCPIYGSKLGSTFKDWACNWASCLLQKIYREIMAVLSHVDQAEQSKLKFHEKTDLCHLSAQTVFSILDCLTVWCHQYFVMLRSSNQNNSKPANKGKIPLGRGEGLST
ncbi:serine/threonine-protein kinase ATR-like [Tachypleus tridentatus]|uniref:serine/threonine-protein kinase ATR-like n=1 Tax=Tachypleus tridentatus TaxID=6853 RepID=UPI003FD0101F